MYQAKSGVKNFSLYLGGGGGGKIPRQKFFSWSEHVSSQIWCQKFFPLLGGGGGVPSTKIFLLVWTCIKPNLVPKIFPFTGAGGGGRKKVPWQKNFSQPEHVSSQIWCQKIFPLLRPGTSPPPPPRTDTHLWKHNLPSYVRTRAVKTLDLNQVRATITKDPIWHWIPWLELSENSKIYYLNFRNKFTCNPKKHMNTDVRVPKAPSGSYGIVDRYTFYRKDQLLLQILCLFYLMSQLACAKVLTQLRI